MCIDFTKSIIFGHLSSRKSFRSDHFPPYMQHVIRISYKKLSSQNSDNIGIFLMKRSNNCAPTFIAHYLGKQFCDVFFSYFDLCIFHKIIYSFLYLDKWYDYFWSLSKTKITVELEKILRILRTLFSFTYAKSVPISYTVGSEIIRALEIAFAIFLWLDGKFSFHACNKQYKA